MTLLNRLEAPFRRWSVPNLTGIIIGGQVLLYIAQYLQAGFDVTRLWLIPGRVMAGEVWRLLTFVFCPPADQTIFVIFFWILLALFGNGLERAWGAARVNLYLTMGVVAMIVGHFAVWLWVGDFGLLAARDQMALLTRGIADPNTFLYGTMFLAFARVYPDYVINLFFILPIRIRWLALIQWIAYAYVMLRGAGPVRVLVVASIFNYLVFFGREHWRDFKSGQRRRSFQARTAAAGSLVHRCLVCGLDSDASPKTLFRYCSKCAGQCCYCPDHIQNHEHVGVDGSTVNEPATADSGKV